MSKLFKFMAKAGLVSAVIVMLALVLVTVAFADPIINRTPDATYPHSSDLNHPEYWGENCQKYEEGFDGDVATMPPGYSLLVLKAGQSNFVWFNPADGLYGTPSFQDISHSIVCRGDIPIPHPPYSKTFTYADCFGVREVTKFYEWKETKRGGYYRVVKVTSKQLHKWSDPLSLETFGEFKEPSYCQLLYLNNDCEGFELFVSIFGHDVTLMKGEWKIKDELEMATYEGKYLDFTVDIFEPEECYECKRESVFYWSDGFCMIRQRGGPIGGQQRPFMPMQDMYCGCGYAHEEGWEGFYAESDCKGAGEEYTYWNELALFCGAQSCE